MSATSLIEKLQEHLGAKNDAALARALNVQPPVISKLRGAQGLGNAMLIRIHEHTGWPIKQIRDLAAEQSAPQQ